MDKGCFRLYKNLMYSSCNMCQYRKTATNITGSTDHKNPTLEQNTQCVSSCFVEKQDYLFSNRHLLNLTFAKNRIRLTYFLSIDELKTD